MSGVRMLHFFKDLWKFIQIHQYYGFNNNKKVTRFVVRFGCNDHSYHDDD